MSVGRELGAVTNSWVWGEPIVIIPGMVSSFIWTTIPLHPRTEVDVCELPSEGVGKFTPLVPTTSLDWLIPSSVNCGFREPSTSV